MLAAALIAGLISACNRVPDGVIKPDKMAALMADIRVADAVVTVNPNDYRNPAAREALKKAVFDRHGVTEADYDSSLVWYGHNIGRYQEVNEMTIKILEDRLRTAGSRASAAAMSVAGDSVDIWNGERLYTFNSRSATKYLTFSLQPDRNWEAGDIYTWHTRFVVPAASAEWAITAEYDDGVIETLYSNMYTSNATRQNLMFITDSTRMAKQISGWIRVTTDDLRPAVLDSVGLIRRRRYDVGSGIRYPKRIVPRAANADTVIHD